VSSILIARSMLQVVIASLAALWACGCRLL
jgi:hypothetical protein